MMALQKTEVTNLYKRRAKRYNFTANLYYLIGFREWAYRKKAVRALELKPGATVVEIGCGTGLNFSLLQREIGPNGKIIGVDLTDAMLAKARYRVHANGWSNVELVHSDAAKYGFPNQVDGIISTFALTLVPEFDKVIENGCNALLPGGRWVVADFKMPSNWFAKLAPLLVFITRPFGVTLDLAERHAWESMKKYLKSFSIEELYGGMAYVASGERGTA